MFNYQLVIEYVNSLMDSKRVEFTKIYFFIDYETYYVFPFKKMEVLVSFTL